MRHQSNQNHGKGSIPLVRSLLVIVALAVATGAMGQELKLPAIGTSGGEVHEGKFIWVDLVTEDLDAASAFYEKLFGWKTEVSSESAEYYIVFNGTKAIGGMTETTGKERDVPESMWVPSMSVADVDAAVAKVKSRGGTLHEGPVEAIGRGRMAVVADPAGAPFILLRATGGDPVDDKPEPNEWFWIDLFTRNAERAGEFYLPFAGYEAETVKIKSGRDYYILKRDGKYRAGVVELKWDDLDDTWLPYVLVDDLEATLAKATALGGTPVLRTQVAAVVLDPTGAAFGIQSAREESK